MMVFFQFDENQGFLGFFDRCQELVLCTQTISKNVWSVLIFAVPLHRQSDKKLMTKDNN